jgi:hypothetical protein
MTFAALKPFGTTRPYGSLGRSAPPAHRISDVRSALRKLLTDAASIARVYPGGLPQTATLPALSYLMVGAHDNRDMDGAESLVEGHYRVSVWSHDAEECHSLVKRIRRGLPGYRGLVDDVRIAGIFVGGELDMPDDPRDGTDDYTYQTILELELQYEELE